MATRYSLDDEKPPYFANIKDARVRCIEDDKWNKLTASREIYSNGKPYACMAKMGKVDGKEYKNLMERAGTPYVYWVWSDGDREAEEYYPVQKDGTTGELIDLRKNADGSIRKDLKDRPFKELYAGCIEKDGKIGHDKFFIDLGDLRRWAKNELLQRQWVLDNPYIQTFMGIPAVLAMAVRKDEKGKKKLYAEGMIMRCSETDAIWGAGEKWNVIAKDGSLGKKYSYPGGHGPTLQDMYDEKGNHIMLSVPNGLMKESSDGKMMSEEEAERKSARKKQMREDLAAGEAKVKVLSEQSLRRLKKKYSAEAIQNATVALGFDVVDSSYTLLMTGEAPIQDSLEEFIQRLEDRVAEEQRKIDERDGNVKKEKKGTVEKMKGLVNNAMGMMSGAVEPAEETKAQLTADAIGDTMYNMNELAHLYFKAMELQDTLVERCVKMTLTAEEIKKLDDACETIVTIVGEKYDAMFSETVQALAEQCSRRE